MDKRLRPSIMEALAANPTNPTVKLCRRCGEIKPRRQFGDALRNRDGLQSWCKTCVLQRARELRKPYVPKPRLKRTEPTAAELEARAERRRVKNNEWRRRNYARVRDLSRINARNYYARRKAHRAAIRQHMATINAADLLTILKD